jgi:hypothetical protein
MLITKEKIVKGSKSKFQIVVFSICTAVGFLMIILPFLLTRKLDLNSISLSAIFFVAFGIPFGYVIGLRNLLKTIKAQKSINADSYKIVIDKIIDMSTVASGRTSDMDDSFCQLTLQYYSNKTNENVCVSFNEFRKLHIGDRCILVFMNNGNKPTNIYPGNEYFLDQSLAGNIIFQA